MRTSDILYTYKKVNVMMKDLSDFKSATKRIPKLLQTFDLSKPNIFKLSNSAALNLMARILGYENYNTIKPVLDKISSKGKKIMKFIQIEKDRFNNVDHMIEYMKSKEKHIFNNEDIYRIKMLFTEYEGHHIEYDFTSDESASKMLNAINEFMQNNETFLNLDALEQKLKNTDNRANQLNPNNNSN